MANLAADSKINFQGPSPRQTRSCVITNALQLYVGSLVILTSGYVAKNVNGGLIIGVAISGGVPGSNPVLDGYALQTLPIPMIAPGNVSTAPTGAANQVIVEQGAFTWQQVTLTIAGTLAGTIADVGTTLYGGNTDNIADATTTQPGTDHPIGKISRFYTKPTATTATYDIDVLDHESRSRGN
jgi:hypothetical protein